MQYRVGVIRMQEPTMAGMDQPPAGTTEASEGAFNEHGAARLHTALMHAKSDGARHVPHAALFFQSTYIRHCAAA